MTSLIGRRVLITGGGRGIGRAIAKAMARAGADVAVSSRTRAELDETAEELAQYGHRVVVVPGDVTSTGEAAEIVQGAAANLGGLDILVNSAGVYGPIGALADTSPNDWWAALRVNLFGTYLCMRSALPHLRNARGVIINLSGGGATAALPNFSSYAASKAAVVRLTETVAQEEAGRVRAYAIAPGAVNTRLLDEVLAAGDRAGQAFRQQALKQRESGGTPPDRAAELAVFLASEAAAPLSGRLISAVWDPWESWRDDSTTIPAASSDTYMLRRTVPGGRQ